MSELFILKIKLSILNGLRLRRWRKLDHSPVRDRASETLIYLGGMVQEFFDLFYKKNFLKTYRMEWEGGSGNARRIFGGGGAGAQRDTWKTEAR